MNDDQDYETIGAVSKQYLQFAIRRKVKSAEWKKMVKDLRETTYEATLKIIVNYLGLV
jgi:hypothetical protein